jgi:PKHD-type hydroxylase
MLGKLLFLCVVASAFSVHDVTVDCEARIELDIDELRHECLEHEVEEACQKLTCIAPQERGEEVNVTASTTGEEVNVTASTTSSGISREKPAAAGAPTKQIPKNSYQRTTWADWVEYDDRPLSNFYYFENGLTPEQADRVVELAKQLPTKDGAVFDSGDTTSIVRSYRKSKIRWIPKTEEFMWLYWELANLINTANNKMWHFDIQGMQEDIQFTEYYGNDHGFYDWHLDVGESTSMRKISIVVMLSDPADYEGGLLQFKTGQTERTVPREKGTVVLFPPYFLHRVTPVTAGTRRTLVLWVSGPPFR